MRPVAAATLAAAAVTLAAIVLPVPDGVALGMLGVALLLAAAGLAHEVLNLSLSWPDVSIREAIGNVRRPVGRALGKIGSAIDPDDPSKDGAP